MWIVPRSDAIVELRLPDGLGTPPLYVKFQNKHKL